MNKNKFNKKKQKVFTSAHIRHLPLLRQTQLVHKNYTDKEMHHNGYKQSFKSHLFLCHSLTSSSDILVIECNVYSQYMRQFSDLLRHTKLLQDTMPLLQISTSKARTHRHAHWRHVVWNTCRVKQQENGTNVLEEILHNFKLV